MNYPPSDEELRDKALRFLKEVKPREYREMQREGALNRLVENKVAACKDYAAALMRSGSSPPEAWNRAIRLEILESESD